MYSAKINVRPWQAVAIVVASIAHIALFFLAHNRWSAGVGYFVLLPLITVAAVFGLRGGLLLGILAHPLNLVLWYLSGETIDQRFFQPNKLGAWGFALVIGAFIGYFKDINTRYRQAVQHLAQTNTKLEHALAEIKTLSGLLPICSGCKRIRDDEGYWQLVEVYIQARSDVEFSHGLCPECATELYPGVFQEPGGHVNKEYPKAFEAHSSYVLDLQFTGDSRTLISAGMDNVVKLWSVPDWALVRTLEGHTNSANSVALSSDEEMLATGSTDTTVKLWSFPEGQELATLQGRKKTVAAVRFSPDREWVAAASYGGRATVWTVAGEKVVSINVSKKNLSSLAFSSDGKTLATSGLGGDITLWSLPSGDRIETLSGHATAVWGLTFVDGGNSLASMGYEGTIRFWDTASWQEARVLPLDQPDVRGMTFSLDERTIALFMAGQVQLWSVQDWTLQAELAVDAKVLSSIAFSPDGRWLAAGGADAKIRVWDSVLK